MKNLQLKLRLLGIYQIVGGLMGIILTLLMVDFYNISNFLLVVFALLLFGYSIYCGILLIRKPKKGLRNSKANQILQTIHFSILGYGFKYVSGLFFSLGFDLTDGFLINIYFGISNWLINANADDAAMNVHLNFVALFLIVLIDKWQRELKTKEMKETIRSIGQDIEPIINHQ
jgi:hypothetical protein